MIQMKHYQTADNSFIQPRSPPRQVKQQKITKTFSNLLQIPLIQQCSQIKHLYLSHNVITNLSNIETYTSLQSLNVSYNHLSDITELNRIIHKNKIKRLGLRMNDFQYGYQDYAVGIFPNLKKIDDLSLPNVEQKRKNYQIAMFISNNILLCRERLNQLKQLLMKSQSLSALPKQLIEQLSMKYLIPQHVAKRSIFELLHILFEVVKRINQDCFSIPQDNYILIIKKQFSQFLQLILLRFSNRNQLQLLRSIQKYTNIVEGFASIGSYKQIKATLTAGGRKYDIKANPGKYINNNQKQYHSNKQKIRSQFQKENQPLFANSGQSKQIEQQFYQRIPMFIYEKNYLQVITQVLMSEIAVIIQIYKKTTEYILIKQKQQQQNKITHKQSPINEHNTLVKTQRNQIINEIHSLSYSNSLPSFGMRQQNQIQLKPSVKIKTNLNNQFPQKNLQDRKTIQKIKNKNYKHLLIQKYQLRQINLLFKVFRSFKMQVKCKKYIN